MDDLVALGDVISIKRGITYKSSLLGMPGPALLGLGSINRHGGFKDGNIKTYGGQSPEALLVRPGEMYASLKDVTQTADVLGAVAILPSGYSAGRLTQDTVRVDVIDDRFSVEYLYWILRTPEYRQYCRNHATGTTTMGLSRDDFFSFRVPLPTPDRVQAARLLGALDDKIACNDRIAAVSEDLAAALYRQAVSSGDAVEVNLTDVFEVDYGAAFKGKLFSDCGIGRPLIRIRDLKTFRPQTWTTETRNDEKLIVPGEVLVGMDGEFCPVWWLGEPALLNQRVCRVRGKSVGSAFVRESLRLPLSQVERSKTGTTVIHLNKADLERIRVLMPSPEALRTFESQAEPLVELRLACAEENRRLTQTRDELLPLLMSGKLRVKDAEQIVEEIA